MVRSVFTLALLLASTAAAALPPDFKAEADALLTQAYAANGPGAAVIVTENGKTVYAAGRGMADIAANRPIRSGDSFRFGSITKQFASATLLKLVEQGKLSLDDPLSKFIPDYPAPGRSATVRQLLSHTSGIADYTEIPGWMVAANTAKAYTTQQLIAVFKDQPATFQPGARWQYDNSGYVLIGAIIEKVTGKPWDQAVAEAITRPLHLTSIRSGVGEPAIPAMVEGYSDKDGKPVLAQDIHMSVPGAAGALVGNVGDLAAWAYALHNGRVLKPATYQAMIAPTRTADGQTAPYGFGIATETLRGEPEIGHNGGIFGFLTSSLYLPRQKLFVAVFANSDSPATNPDVLSRKLAALALGKPYREFATVAIDPGSVAPWLGVYGFANAERTLFMRDGKYHARRTGGGDAEIYPAGGKLFYYGKDNLSWFELGRDGAGKPVFNFHGDGADEASVGTWKGPVPVEAAAFAVPAAALDLYAGTYTSAVGPFLIKHEGGTLTVKLGGQPTLPMKATSATDFEITQVDARIRFNMQDGKAASMTLFQGGQEIAGVRSN